MQSKEDVGSTGVETILNCLCFCASISQSKSFNSLLVSASHRATCDAVTHPVSLGLTPPQVGFQKILTLTYVDKFIDDVQLHFRDRYKNELEQKGAMKLLNHSYEFGDDFNMLLR